ncbi:MAG: hypothetical protein U0791_14990 [Gemmataceae bacterium]
MTPNSWKRRIAILVERLRPAEASHLARRLQEEACRRRAEHLGRVPAKYRPSVEAALGDPVQADSWSEWIWQPFASWAAIPSGFSFPGELLAWLLHPPREWFLGHCCGRCGLKVPLILTWHNDPDPPPDGVIVFPQCPSCGGPTSFMATFRADEPS